MLVHVSQVRTRRVVARTFMAEGGDIVFDGVGNIGTTPGAHIPGGGEVVAPAAMGRLVGVGSKGVFTVDEVTHKQRLLAAWPGKVSGGFAVSGREVFFTDGPDIISYTVAEPVAL